MTCRCSINCIVPPHILQHLLKSDDEKIREVALNTLLATTELRAERQIIAEVGFAHSIAGTKRRTIFDCRNGRFLPLARLMRGEGDADTKDLSINRAYGGLGKTYDFYREVFKRNSIDDKGMRLDGYVHYDRAFNNAFWNGRQMIFGDGDGEIFTDFTASLDVIAHELSHGVTEFAAGLEYHNQSGALNESISDVFGSMVEQWARSETVDQANWLIGDEIFSPRIQGDGLRSLKSPGSAYDDPVLGKDPQPAHMNDFARLPDTREGDWGGVHINSGIPNHAFYLVATSLGGHAWEAPGHIWYEALKTSGPRTDFEEFADRTYQAAGRLYGTASSQQKAVQEAWREVGVRVSADGAPTDSSTTPGGAESDSLAALQKQVAAIAQELKALSTDVAQLKKKEMLSAM